MARFVQPLGHHHGLLDAKAETGAGSLLQCRGDIRRARLAAGRLIFTIHDLIARFFQQRDGSIRFVAVDRTEGFIAFVRHVHRQLIAFRRGQRGINFPVLFGNKSFNLTFTFHHQANGNGLHTSGRETTGDLFPQQWRDHVAHHAVHKATRLLSIYPINIQFARLFKRLTNRILGYFVKHDAAEARVITTNHFPQVPGNGFPFAVKVGCEIDVVSIGG